MTCEVLGDGILCHRGRRRRRCGCKHLAGKLCDALVPGGGTCDVPLCSHCTTHVEPDTDYCESHKHLVQQQLPLPL